MLGLRKILRALAIVICAVIGAVIAYGSTSGMETAIGWGFMLSCARPDRYVVLVAVVGTAGCNVIVQSRADTKRALGAAKVQDGVRDLGAAVDRRLDWIGEVAVVVAEDAKVDAIRRCGRRLRA